MGQLPRLGRVWFVAQCNIVHRKDKLHTFIDVLIHTAMTTAQHLEFILAYTSVAGPGDICTYIKDHEDPLDDSLRDVWHILPSIPPSTYSS